VGFSFDELALDPDLALLTPANWPLSYAPGTR
jgi:hypothetical protein